MGGGAEVSLITFICRVQHVPSRALEVSIIAYQSTHYSTDIQLDRIENDPLARQ